MKKLLITSLILFVSGVIICGSVFAVKGKEILVEEDLVETSYEFDDVISNVHIEAIKNDVLFEVSRDGQCRVECLDLEGMEHEVTVTGDTLTITSEGDIEDLFDITRINVFHSSPRITVYLPEAEYESLVIDAANSDVVLDQDIIFSDVDINLDDGDVNISNYHSDGDISVDVDAGDLQVVNTTCRNLTYNGDTGDVTLNNSIISEQLNISILFGDVTFDGSDAFSIIVEIDSGDIEGTLLTAKTFDCSVQTGDVEIPGNGNGGNCQLHIGAGDIEIDIED